MIESSSPRLLTADLLAELEQRLRALGAPITRILRPGLSDDQMDELTGPIGLTLSTEARAWWRWHDGAEPGGRHTAIGDGWVPLPLAEAVRSALVYRGISTVEIDADGNDNRSSVWLDSWIALCGNASAERLACECAVPAGEPSPAIYFEPLSNDDPEIPKAASIGEVVHVWFDALDDGTWHIDPATGDFAVVDVETLEAKGPDIADLL